MPKEIEYRFLVDSDAWRSELEGARSRRIEQSYAFAADHGNMRIRIIDGTEAIITVKGARDGAVRPEYEWSVDLQTGQEMIADLCVRPPVTKTRWALAGAWEGWTVDEFDGENVGLVIAEREVEQVDEDFPRPPWLGREVTSDRAFSNASLQFEPQPRPRA